MLVAYEKKPPDFRQMALPINHCYNLANSKYIYIRIRHFVV